MNPWWLAQVCKNAEWVAQRDICSAFFYTRAPHHGFTSGKIDCVYHTVKYSNSAYFLVYALVNPYPLHTCTVIYSIKIYSHYVTDKLFQRLENQWHKRRRRQPMSQDVWPWRVICDVIFDTTSLISVLSFLYIEHSTRIQNISSLSHTSPLP